MFRVLVKVLIFFLMVLIVMTVSLMALTRPAGAGSPGTIAGYRPLTVLGGSMEPSIHIGGIVITKAVKLGDVRPGDVITFRTPVSPGNEAITSGTFTTHRVVEIKTGQNGRMEYVTKGDANRTADNWTISDQNVVGRVCWTVPYLGYLANYMRTKTGFLLALVLPAVTIIIIEISGLAAEVRRRSAIESRVM